MPLWSLYNYTEITRQGPILIIKAPRVGQCSQSFSDDRALRSSSCDLILGLGVLYFNTFCWFVFPIIATYT